jgi:uncharacterized protein (TIGR02246 family)
MPAHRPAELHVLFVDAFNRGDVEALLELYEPDAVFITSPGQHVAGLDEIRAAIEGMLELGGKVRITTRWSTECGDLALLHGDWELPGTGADGQPVHISALDTEVARRQPDGTWRFVIDDPFGNVDPAA